MEEINEESDNYSSKTDSSFDEDDKSDENLESEENKEVEVTKPKIESIEELKEFLNLNDKDKNILKRLDDFITEDQILRPQFQDISPSFADEVPFLVDGDSLMITVMSDPNWSGQYGGSSLHLIYLFERYLNIFVQRGGVFHIVFFQTWRRIWNENWNIHLHRQILINHFRKNTENYSVILFNSCFDVEFYELISTLRPGFILTNMFIYEDCLKLPLKIKEKINIEHLINIHLLWWLNWDLPCICTNDIEVDITIVNGLYLEPNMKVRIIVNLLKNIFVSFMQNLPQLPKLNLPTIERTIETYDIRTNIILTAAELFYKNCNDDQMLKIFFLTTAFMDYFELKHRCCPKFKSTSPQLEEMAATWNKCMLLALIKLKTIPCDWNSISDLWQGILFGHICHFASNRIDNKEQLGTNVAYFYENLVQEFNNFGHDMTPYPIHIDYLESNFEVNDVDKKLLDFKPLLHVENPLVIEFCGSILKNIKWAEPLDNLFNKIYTEDRHYHSMKVLTDEYDYIKNSYEKMPADFRERRRYQRQQSSNAKYMSIYGANIEGRPLEYRPIIRNFNKINKKEKTSQSAQKIIEENLKNNDDEKQKDEKQKLDNVKNKLDKIKHNLDDLSNLLEDIEQKMNKFRIDSPYMVKILCVKLEILLRMLASKNIDNEDDIKKKIFLAVRTVLTDCPLDTIHSKAKDILSKCLIAIDCHEIARRNGLSIDEEAVFEDTWIRYQLEELGPELIRETGGVPDSRVTGFIPDPWQKELFDIVDKRQSAVIVAPTSSGKTYSSYYCMESVLRESVDGIVVYVAPTKALVNQVAATVYARFKDTNMPDGMSVYGVFTRDYRTHAANSQILITVPQCLEILLMSPRRFNWVSKLRYIIFDEIHCIAGQMGGIQFERCLLLIRCPFLALSATIRYPENLQAWLQKTENFKRSRDKQDGCLRKTSYNVHLVVHLERHSDLVKYTYGEKELHHLHPYANLEPSVINIHRGIPKHMILSPAETMQLYDAMIYANAGSFDLKQLAPERFFSEIPKNGFISRNMVQIYETDLSSLLSKWFDENRDDFYRTIDYFKCDDEDTVTGNGKQYILRNIVDFVLNLQSNGMLPAIIFAYDRQLIEKMTKELTRNLNEKTEISRREQKRSDKLEKKEKKMLQRSLDKEGAASTSKEPKRNSDLTSGHRDFRLRNRSIYQNRTRLNLLSGGGDKSIQGKGLDSEELEVIESRLMRGGANRLMVQSIQNGLCYHHGGLNNKLRSSVEMLFRKKLLNVVFATGTLALGIHMPCKTTVIAGNSGYLNSLEYHQMSGRAGRRGYDTAGNVIFLGINPRKQHSLLTAKLPDIKGNFPITVTLILRLLLLVSDVTDKGKKSDEATKITVSRVISLLENSLSFMHEKNLKMKIQHFFSFSLQLLQKQEFINNKGEPLKWCGLATHLHYHEPGNIAFVFLLRTGVIRRICTEIDNTEDILYTLLVVLSYLFTSIPVSTTKTEFENSKVILDPLPDYVYEALEDYNAQVEFIFDQFFINVANNSSEPDNVLPLSAVQIEPKNCDIEQNYDADNVQNKFFKMCIPKIMCSSFSALSGNGDDNLYSSENLISNIKQSMTTDVKVIPLIDLNKELNSYALDFYRHGIVKSIREDNGLKGGTEFSLIKDFLLILKTIVVSLEEMQIKDEKDVVYVNFVKLRDTYNEIYKTAFNIFDGN